MEILHYFKKVSGVGVRKTYNFEKTLGNLITLNNEDAKITSLEDYKVAIIGVPESRGIGKIQSINSNFFRESFYSFFSSKNIQPNQVIDLGDIIPGEKKEDTYFALADVLHELLSKKIIPVIIGGTDDLAFANFKAYERFEHTINITHISKSIPLGNPEEEILNTNWLNKVILYQPNYLFNYSHLAFQSFYVDESEKELLDSLNFDFHRLGEISNNVEQAEPIVRNSDMLSFNMDAIRNSDANEVFNSSPNGLFGHQACQIAKYAGISDKLTSFGIYNANLSGCSVTSELMAQMVWYFIEGVFQRKNDYPAGKIDNYTKYNVALKTSEHEVAFYKSDKSQRWWMQIPYPASVLLKNQRHYLVPCTYEDYQKACNDELPDRWLKTYHKLI